MRILLIEDDALLADGLARTLRHAGYIVDLAADGRTADGLLADESYDLAILDLGLPGLDGSEVLQRLRARRQQTPVLVLSARLAVEERVRLLDLGADDYVVKPVSLDELEARVRALIRRGQGGGAVPDVMLGRLRLDTVGKRAWLDDTALDLNAREWAAMEFLATRVNRIVSKEQLMQALYSWQDDISPNAIEKLMSRLRSKIEVAGITIRTVRGLGYYLEKPDDAGA
ncbi:response regulator transcription factor [Dechloromonas sp. XY25]|uniref:Response regulator transcription factor n=1 Tax=Dechloromonas hankyongensis TaxID=2908002 RepID=A0ABS9K2Q9_9RHOO|nr:response regulator transcription factor [Dechloromonas hankyongensis]MCG2577467.1 response regulator transcription factor [Dechloromonas hankyongensis]